MIRFSTTILKFGNQGEKTGWTYIEIPVDIAVQIKPGYKKSFRVKGKLDNYPIEKTALLPMGHGSFILPLKAEIRKGLGKRHGAILNVQIEEDPSKLELNTELMQCLADEAEAFNFFTNLPLSHQHYFSKWIESAKTDITKTSRIAQTLSAMVNRQGFSEMMRSLKNKKLP